MPRRSVSLMLNCFAKATRLGSTHRQLGCRPSPLVAHSEGRFLVAGLSARESPSFCARPLTRWADTASFPARNCPPLFYALQSVGRVRVLSGKRAAHLLRDVVEYPPLEDCPLQRYQEGSYAYTQEQYAKSKRDAEYHKYLLGRPVAQLIAERGY